jgi:hypothetical protein
VNDKFELENTKISLFQLDDSLDEVGVKLKISNFID